MRAHQCNTVIQAHKLLPGDYFTALTTLSKQFIRAPTLFPDRLASTAEHVNLAVTQLVNHAFRQIWCTEVIKAERLHSQLGLPSKRLVVHACGCYQMQLASGIGMHMHNTGVCTALLECNPATQLPDGLLISMSGSNSCALIVQTSGIVPL